MNRHWRIEDRDEEQTQCVAQTSERAQRDERGDDPGRKVASVALDANEDGACQQATEVLRSVVEALGFDDSHGVRLLGQIDVLHPVAEVPPPHPFVACAVPALPQAARRLALAQLGPLHVRDDAPDDREGRHAGK